MFECHPRGRLLSTAFDYNLTKLEPTGFLFTAFLYKHLMSACFATLFILHVGW
jgi:hypothetical protein